MARLASLFGRSLLLRSSVPRIGDMLLPRSHSSIVTCSYVSWHYSCWLASGHGCCHAVLPAVHIALAFCGCPLPHNVRRLVSLSRPPPRGPLLLGVCAVYLRPRGRHRLARSRSSKAPSCNVPAVSADWAPPDVAAVPAGSLSLQASRDENVSGSKLGCRRPVVSNTTRTLSARASC